MQPIRVRKVVGYCPNKRRSFNELMEGVKIDNETFKEIDKKFNIVLTNL